MCRSILPSSHVEQVKTEQVKTSPMRECLMSGLLFLPVTVLVFELSLFFAPDYLFLFEPFTKYFAGELAVGSFPWWNPYTGLGRPFFSDVHTGLHYPPTYLLLVPFAGVHLIVWLHCAFGAMGMKRLCVSLGAASGWAWLAGFSFVFSGFLCGRLFAGQLFVVFGFLYLPWILKEVLELDTNWTRPRTIRLAVLMALQFLTGHPQVFWLSNVGIWTLLLLLVILDGRDANRSTQLRRVGQLASATVVAVGLACFSWLPFLDLVAHSNRTEPTIESASFLAFQWNYLTGLFAGTSVPPMESNAFTGAVWVLSGLFGLFAVKDKRLRALFAVALLALAFSLGQSSPVFRAAFHLAPGADGFRIPARALIWATLALIILGAVAMTTLQQRVGEKKGRGALLIFAVLFLIELGVMLPKWKSEYTRNARVDYLFANQFKEWTKDLNLESPTNTPPRCNLSLGILPANWAAELRLCHVNGDTPLFLGRPWRYLHASRGIQPDPRINTSLNPKVVQSDPLKIPYVTVNVGVQGDGSHSAIVVETNPVPRAWFSVSAHRSSGESESLAAMTGGFPAHVMTLVEQDPTTSIPMGIPVPIQPLDIQWFESSRLLIDVHAPQAGFLVLNEAWFPGWKARVGRKVIDAQPVNHWMRGFELPAGEHRIEVYFRPRFLSFGCFVSLATLMGLFVWSRKVQPKDVEKKPADV